MLTSLYIDLMLIFSMLTDLMSISLLNTVQLLFVKYNHFVLAILTILAIFAIFTINKEAQSKNKEVQAKKVKEAYAIFIRF